MEYQTIMPRTIEFKTSVALSLSGLEISAKKLQEYIGREKPSGQHHMRYTPADIRAARYRYAGVDQPNSQSLFPAAKPFPPLIVCRMTKGGVGKTSTSVNLAAALGMMGFRVLFIDADPQASASNLLGVDSNFSDDVTHIGGFLVKKSGTADPELSKAIMSIYEGGFLDLIPADITLTEADARMVTEMNSHERALKFLTRNGQYLNQNYDCIVVDTAPGTTPIGLAFTYASKDSAKFLTVVEPEGTCLRALESLNANLNEIKVVTNADIRMEIVINRWHPSLKHVKENMGILYTKYGHCLNDTIIPQFSGFARQMDPNSSKESRPLVESDPSSVGAVAIIDLAKSIIHSFGITHPGLTMAGTPEAAAA